MPYYIDNIEDLDKIENFNNDQSFIVINPSKRKCPLLKRKARISRIKLLSSNDKNEIINSFYITFNELLKESGRFVDSSISLCKLHKIYIEEEERKQNEINLKRKRNEEFLRLVRIKK